MRNNSRQFSFYVLKRKSPFFDSAIPHFRTMSFHRVGCSVDEYPDSVVIGISPLNKVDVPIISAYSFTEGSYVQ